MKSRNILIRRSTAIVQRIADGGFQPAAYLHFDRWYKSDSGHAHQRNQYTELRPAISICVLTQAMFPQSSELHLDFFAFPNSILPRILQSK